MIDCCRRGFKLGRTGKTKDLKNREKCIELLLKNGADVNYRNPISGMTALHWATVNNHLEVVLNLEEHGATQLLN